MTTRTGKSILASEWHVARGFRLPYVPGQVIAMRRSIAILLAGGLLALGSLVLAGGATAAPIAPTVALGGGATAESTIASTTTCGNGLGNVGGRGLICEVTIVNRITAGGGSATVTVRECQGAAGPPATQTACTKRTVRLTKPVTAVTQCNDALNGGGGTLRCSVKVTNNFVGLKTGATAATVNQCVGSGAGGGTGLTAYCEPFPATTSGATITQCNGSANGGGVVTGSSCTATGTKPSAHGVKINQCNGSANGGGSLIICSANITNKALAAGSSPGPSRTSGPTTPPTDMLATTDVPGSGMTPVVFLGIFLAAIAAIVSWCSLRARPRRTTSPQRHR